MKKFVLTLTVAFLALGACSSKDSLEKRGPDEYMVLTNPPLVLPPDFTLRAPVKTEEPAVSAAQERVKKDFALPAAKQSGEKLSEGESALLQKAGKGDENIKEILKKNDDEYEKNTLVLDKKLKTAPTQASVNAQKEAETLQKQGVKTPGATQP